MVACHIVVAAADDDDRTDAGGGVGGDDDDDHGRPRSSCWLDEQGVPVWNYMPPGIGSPC